MSRIWWKNSFAFYWFYLCACISVFWYVLIFNVTTQNVIWKRQLASNCYHHAILCIDGLVKSPVIIIGRSYCLENITKAVWGQEIYSVATINICIMLRDKCNFGNYSEIKLFQSCFTSCTISDSNAQYKFVYSKSLVRILVREIPVALFRGTFHNCCTSIPL